MDPKEYNLLKAFRDLLADSVSQLQNAAGQSQLASTASELAGRWDDADEEFANVLRDISRQARTMSFAQVRPVVQAITGHIQAQLSEVEARLNS